MLFNQTRRFYLICNLNDILENYIMKKNWLILLMAWPKSFWTESRNSKFSPALCCYMFFLSFGIKDSNTFNIDIWIPLKQVLGVWEMLNSWLSLMSRLNKSSLQILLLYFGLDALKSQLLPEVLNETLNWRSILW